MKAHRSDIVRIILTPILEIILFSSAFWIAYNLRSITDGIPFVQLRIPYISEQQFLPFVIAGVILWIIIFVRSKLYSHIKKPLFDEIRIVITYSFFWFLFYIGFVYLTQGFLFHKEIPRLIIIYTLFIGIFFSIFARTTIHYIWKKLSAKNIITKQKILVIQQNKDDEIIFQLNKDDALYTFVDAKEITKIEDLMRTQQIEAIILTSGEYGEKHLESILRLAKIYGIQCSYPRIMPHMKHFLREESFLGGIPVITLTAVAITPWKSVIKRITDIILSSIFLILLFPILLIVYIGIKIEDPKGPAIYKNRRIGQDGKIFTLYKFRYMYWKYCIKEEYGKNNENDEAIQFEENLKKQNNTRNGPLYKIQNDPRKMKFGGFIERFSIDELPQLFNVLVGNMSLVGPRPHQPREVNLYDETDRQVLTIKPGITGMAQVYGRDKNSFKKEVLLDTYYIENYSFFLDLLIIFRTVLVVMKRPFEKKK